MFFNLNHVRVACKCQEKPSTVKYLIFLSRKISSSLWTLYETNSVKPSGRPIFASDPLWYVLAKSLNSWLLSLTLQKLHYLLLFIFSRIKVFFAKKNRLTIQVAKQMRIKRLCSMWDSKKWKRTISHFPCHEA